MILAREDLIAESNQFGIAAIAAPEKKTIELLENGARQSPECFPIDLCAFVSLPVFIQQAFCRIKSLPSRLT